MSLERVIKVAAASVPVPPTGYLYRFIDIADGLLKVKDEFNVVSVVSSQFGTNGITNGYLEQIATQTIKGRTTAGTGNVEDLNATQVTAMLNSFTSVLKGLVPASGGGTVNFLRADGNFANPLPLAYDASSSASTTNANITDTLLSGMSITPAAGTYICRFDTSADSTTNGRLHYFSVYVNGTQIAASERLIFTDTAKYQNVSVSSGKFTVTGSEAVEIRHRMSAGTGTIYQRIMNLTRCQ